MPLPDALAALERMFMDMARGHPKAHDQLVKALNDSAGRAERLLHPPPRRRGAPSVGMFANARARRAREESAKLAAMTEPKAD